MPMLNLLLKWLTKFLSTLLNNIFAVILVSAIGIPALISWATGTLNILIQAIKAPTPLWGTIVLVLLSGVYIYLKKPKDQSCSKAILYTVDNLKWEVTINSFGNYNVSKTPYCIKHELKLIQSTNRVVWKCPKLSECYTKINNSNIRNLRKKALSHIEKAVRDKNIKY